MKALIIVDMQHDFMPGGALGVPGANEIIPTINRLMPQYDCVVATVDWHPLNHVSFASTHHKRAGERIIVDGIEQILWPEHCIQDTHGAHLVHGLNKDRIEEIFHKGSDRAVDSYSAFFDNAHKKDTGLAAYLNKRGIEDLYFAGVATEYCVLYSVLDAISLGFRAHVLLKACRPINLCADDEAKALHRMREAGAVIFEKE